ncbi:hypothetical protein BsWGS_21709 [Bradybaena similaris]
MFKATYKCFSVSILGNREDVERGGKIIMPPSALDQLTRLNIQYPMLFKLTNRKTNKETHCGVLEFVAEEGRVFIPYWLMRNLRLEQGDLVQVDNVSLAVATYARFQPQSVDFLDITNHKAVLENALRTFACITEGDFLTINYNDKDYELCVLENRPGKAVSIIECDMIVEFASPVGYKEPERWSADSKLTDQTSMDTDQDDKEETFMPFGGQGNRLDGKKKESQSAISSPAHVGPVRRGVPNHNFKRGTITFIRNVRPASIEKTNNEDKEFQVFSGQGQKLRSKMIK